MTWESWSVGDVTGSTHKGSAVGMGQYVEVGEGPSVDVAVPVGDGWAGGFRFTGLAVGFAGKKGTGVEVEVGSGVNVSVGRCVAVAVGEGLGLCVCVESAVSVGRTVGEACTTAGAATGAQAVLVSSRMTRIVRTRRCIFTTFLTVMERTRGFYFTRLSHRAPSTFLPRILARQAVSRSHATSQTRYGILQAT
jgi:hypothetical protein